MPESWVKTGNAFLFSALNTGTTLENTETNTDISPGANTAGKAFTVGQDCPLLVAGSLIRVTAGGTFSTTGTPALTMALYWGGAAGVALATSAAITTASGAANNVWYLDATIRVLTKGESGTASTLGVLTGLGGATSSALLPATSATGGEATVNTQVAKTLTLAAKWGTASASNKITVYQWIVETLTAPT